MRQIEKKVGKKKRKRTQPRVASETIYDKTVTIQLDALILNTKKPIDKK